MPGTAPHGGRNGESARAFRPRRGHPAPAAELYVGPYHRACRAAAERLTATSGFLLILSGLHGFVPPARVLEPYDVPLGSPGSITTDKLREQARQFGFEQADVTVLVGRTYAEACRAVWPLAETPLLGMGIGYQRQHLTALRDGRL
jgi:uncharacterized protein DUF6884